MHIGYFCQHKSKSGEVIFEDSKTGEAESDRAAYDLILKDKERLLSMDEPLAFIFSHSALREGWDNPNESHYILDRGSFGGPWPDWHACDHPSAFRVRFLAAFDRLYRSGCGQPVRRFLADEQGSGRPVLAQQSG